MEDIHGVDVSWIHHSQLKDRIHHRQYTSKDESKLLPSPPKSADPPKPAQSDPSPNDHPESTPPAIQTSEPVATPPHTPSTTPQSISKRPSGLLRRSSKERASQNGTSADPNKASPRRSSWISSLSSKISQSSPAQSTNVVANGQITATRESPLHRTPSPGAPVPTGEDGRPYVPQAPRTSGTSFFQNALRRLSSSSQLGTAGRMYPDGHICPRRVMNVDPNRQRCLLPELEPAKLKRVAFCVDVEIAGGPRYKDETEGDSKKKEKSKKIKERAEGEALKHPELLVEEKEKADMGISQVESALAIEEPAKEEKPMSRKKEKKKRSEEERKERKEQKRRKAEESGSIPMVITRNSAEVSDKEGSDDKMPRPLDRPTTDPLRIYRRCCQLRETPVLKRIADQLAASVNCIIKERGVVTQLDLTGSRLQLADIVTLSDWLAIVPVKKLILNDSDLNDEGVRVILAGLLAAVTPDFFCKRRLPKGETYDERSGVVEKLSLKNNQRITKEGWKHISLFIYMCRSLRSLDLSMISFPPSPAHHAHYHEHSTLHGALHVDPADVFAKALSARIAGSHFEELVMGECNLSTNQIRKIVDAVTMSGIKRLGLAGNNMTEEALEHVIHYIRSGICQGLDLGGNDLRDHLESLSHSFDPSCQLWALSFADCGLDPASLKSLFPGLLNLTNLRFLDLSYNPELFTSPASALSLLRKYLPMFPELRRIHLNNVSMAPHQAIALADVLSECPQLAHISILGNPALSALASATEEDAQEEAVALYASLMAAARVSTSIISIDIDVPTTENSEIVKALAKQVVAYCLRNMDKYYAATVSSDAASESSASDSRIGSLSKEVEIPEVLLHLVGNSDGVVLPPNDDEPVPDNDYIVGGTGVVKALNYCLAEFRRGSGVTSGPQSGTVTPLPHAHIGAKAKAMSLNLLDSARKIRARLQPALAREAKGNDDMAFRRLLFLDNTLKGIIQRFEDEFPPTRHDTDALDDAMSHVSSTSTTAASPTTEPTSLATSATLRPDAASDSESDAETEALPVPPSLRRSSRHASDVSLAAKAQAMEEGRVLRINEDMKRAKHKGKVVTGLADDEHVRVLRAKLRALETPEDVEAAVDA